MAQEVSTAGIYLKYGDAAVDSQTGAVTIPTSWTNIPNITSTPSMGSAPEALDVTDLGDLIYKRSIPGLIDLGGIMEFEANFTEGLVSAVDSALETPASGFRRAFAIEYSAINKTVWWCGEVQPVMPGEAAVGEVLTATISVSLETTPVMVDTVSS